ncbi:MAG: phenylalanine--tRNA ligase subunit beta [Rhodanobacteraceae bacterium]|nr:MAG: phenylalanine--tRNA ligase subunit beta [Rhodanobacteraceae bacterium]
MKFSENWLRQLVAIPADRAMLLQRLTLSGLEVAGAEVVGGDLPGVVVARIQACDAHPNADKLHICRVDTGAGEVQIVCGAPNARAGLVAPLATLGAKLPGGITIKAAKLRGVESSGMLCSAKELGIATDATGLMELPADAPVGQPLAEYLGLPDAAIEIELTPNRGDCLGMAGLADEVAAEFGTRAKPLEVAPVVPAIAAPRVIRLDAGTDCPCYLGRAVRGIDIAAATPAWMAQRLRVAGIKPINAVVDVTNYVMLETGQPLHAFDESKLAGDIVVRHARAGEAVKLLTGDSAELDPSFVVITDPSQVLAVAGVIGGFDSRVTAATRDIFLEAAHFVPAAIMGKARTLGLATDAAHRFERGVDPALPRVALERATALLVAVAGGKAGEILGATLPGFRPERQPVTLRRARIARVLGVSVADGAVEATLAGLGMTVERQPDGWRATPRSRRFDIEREEDLIEEVARIHGYAAIPAQLPSGAPPLPRDDEGVLPARALNAVLAARDYHEAICYAFVDPRWLEAWQLAGRVVALANPLSAELADMRPSLLPGLVDAIKRNRNRQQSRVRLFETGSVFAPPDPAAPGDGAPVETAMLAAAACGTAHAEQWGTPARALDFYDLRGDLEALLALSGVPAAWSFDAHGIPPWMHPGRSARVLRDGIAVGEVGALHPALQRQLDVPEIYLFEVQLTALRQRAVPVAGRLPRFPSVRRDIAIEVDEGVEWARIEAAVRSGLQTMLNELVLFDCFRGPGLQTGRKSLAIGLILQDDSRTLTDQDADRCVADVLALLEREFGAKLRS